MPTQYPALVFHFQVVWGGANLGFSEVAGLTIEHQVVEYRDGMMQEYGPIKQPGIPKFANITMNRGIVKADNEFWTWFDSVKLNKVERRDLTISLLDETHAPIM